MPSIMLSNKEISILKQWIRRQSPIDELQKLLDTLDSLLDEETGRIDLTEELVEKLREVTLSKGNPMASATLLAVFQRTLGADLAKK